MITSKYHQSVVKKVEDNLEDEAEKGGHCDPQVKTVDFGERLVFPILCSYKP